MLLIYRPLVFNQSIFRTVPTFRREGEISAALEVLNHLQEATKTIIAPVKQMRSWSDSKVVNINADTQSSAEPPEPVNTENTYQLTNTQLLIFAPRLS